LKGIEGSVKRLLTIFSVHQALHWFLIGLIAPILALFQMEKGLNLLQIGINIAIYSGTVILLELPTGGLADTIGRKKVYIYSLAAKCISVVVLLFSKSFLSVAAGFVFFGIARALSSGSMDAWFVDEFRKIHPKGNLQHALAVIGIFVPIGLGVGSIAGGFLPDLLGPILSKIPIFDIYSINFLAILVFIGIQFIYTSTAISETVDANIEGGIIAGLKKVPIVISESIQYGLKDRVILKLLIATAALGVGLAGMENFWQPRLKVIIGQDSSTRIFGLLSAGYFFAASLGSLIITPICTLFRNNYAKILFALRIFLSGFYCLLAMQTGLAGFSFFYISLFFFNGLSNAPHAAVLNERVPQEKRSTLLSFESLVLQLGAAGSSIIMGYIANTVSIPVSWYISAAVLFLSSFAYLLIRKESVPRRSDEPMDD
jgi:MFS transporter, DHA1 family, quinolone resistance protein